MKGHTALVTGGGRGIGEAVARRLAREGARVILVARTEGEIKRVAGEIGASFHVCDVTVPDQIEAVARSVQPVHILVNNAGVAESAPFQRTTLAMWRRAIDTNVTAAFLFAQAVVPGMVERKYGRIVNIASIAGKHGAPYISAYAASKHALLGLNSCLAKELETHGIRVNALCPRYVDTSMVRAGVARIAAATGRPEEEVLKALLASVGQERMLEPGVIAELAFLLSRTDCPHNGEAIDL